ncbi:MAG: NFYB/HAP3 family transcription factor subunit [Elusimicrobia bacterium]|nr:NFYB/HAP3 family transcription factor subunit [Elusimicrobiota bacterium]
MPRIRKEVPPNIIKRLFKNVLGDEFKISDEACSYLSDFVEKLVKEIGIEASKVAKFTKRKTIKKRDIEFVLEDVGRIANKIAEKMVG